MMNKSGTLHIYAATTTGLHHVFELAAEHPMLRLPLETDSRCKAYA